MRRILLLALCLLAGFGIRAEPAEAQSRRHCATERALGRYPPGCPRPATPRPTPRPPLADRGQHAPVRTHELFLRNGCNERLQIMLDFRTARGFEQSTDDAGWSLGRGETTGPMTLRGRRLALVSDEIYYAVNGESGSPWRLAGSVRRRYRGGQLNMARAPVSVEGSAYVVTFCRPPGTQAEIPGRYLLFFSTDSAEIIPEARPILDEAVVSYSRLGDASYRVIVAGHDHLRPGNAMANSRRRAAAVRDYLVTRGLPAASITTEAWGASRPLIDGRDETSDAQNRRVEIIFGAARPR